MLLILIVFVLIVLGAIYFCKPSKPVEAFQMTRDTTPERTNFRVTNTVLSAANVFHKKIDELQLPESVRENFNEWIEKGFVSPVKDQMLCGGCWAFAACGILADRIAIATNGRWKTPFGLSEQYLISCGENLGMNLYKGCDGGIPYFAMNALAKEGVPEDVDCKNCKGGAGAPVEINRVGVVNPNGSSMCTKIGKYGETEYTWWQTGCDGNATCGLLPASTCPCAQIVTKINENVPLTATNKYKTVGKAHSYTTHTTDDRVKAVDLWPEIPDSVKAKNVERMKKAIYYYGPIAVGYSISTDFYDWWPKARSDNYYKYDGVSQMTGGHAVVIVGWKKMDDGTPVWIVKNDWGSQLGYGFDKPTLENGKQMYPGGFWNHRMGQNDSYIESNAAGCFPDLKVPHIEKFLPSGLPDDWHDKMTLRDVYTASQMYPPSGVEDKKEKPPFGPAPTINKLVTSDKFKITTLNPNNVSMKSIEIFFSGNKSLYMIGGTGQDQVQKVVDALPKNEKLSNSKISEIVKNINVDEYIILVGKDNMGMFYSLSGVPTNWKITNPNIQKSATPHKLANDVYYKFLGLQSGDIILQIEGEN